MYECQRDFFLLAVRLKCGTSIDHGRCLLISQQGGEWGVENLLANCLGQKASQFV